jgi:hypothetical protein
MGLPRIHEKCWSHASTWSKFYWIILVRSMTIVGGSWVNLDAKLEWNVGGVQVPPKFKCHTYHSGILVKYGCK